MATDDRHRLTNGLLFIAALWLAGCSTTSGGSTDSMRESRLNEPAPPTGVFKITRHRGDRLSHHGALIAISQSPSNPNQFGFMFAPKMGQYAGEYTECITTTKLNDGAYECWVDKRASENRWERFRYASLDSTFCRERRTALQGKFTPNPIMQDCPNEDDGGTCICFNVSHCETGDDSNCEDGDDPRHNLKSPPGNGSGSGGGWP